MLPSMYASSACYDSAFVNVLRACSKIAQPFGAKLLFFQFSPQLANIPSLKPKNNPSATERLDLLNSTGSDFSTTGSDLSHQQISCDLFVFTPPGKSIYKNLETFSDLAKRTNGHLYFYPFFSAREHSAKFTSELYLALTQPLAWEAVGRVRVSGGFKKTLLHGHHLVKARTEDLLSLPVCDTERVFVYELDKDDTEAAAKQVNRRNEPVQSHLFAQTAFLYTSSNGERRIRVHNMAVPITNSLTQPFEYMDLAAVSALYMRQGISRMYSSGNFGSAR